MTHTKTRFAALLLLVAALLIAATGCGAKPQSNAPDEQGSNVQESDEPELLGPDNHPIVTIEMSNDKIIKVELYPEVAPNTVNNFVSLIQKGFYDGVIFHRVMPGFMIQGGDPEGTGYGGPGYTIPGEFNENEFTNKLKHTRGVISMARSLEPDSAGSQFFIMVADSPHLDNKYASFGKVIEGMEVADEIVNQATDAKDRPLESPLFMKKVTVDTLDLGFEEPVTIK